MTLRDSLLPVLDSARTALGGFGLRTNTVTRRLRTWTSGRIGDPMPATAGTDYIDDDLLLEPSPKAREVSAREVAGSGGRYEDADFVIGPITPAYAGGGYTVDQLNPTITADGVELIYVLAGPNAGEYYLHDATVDRSMRYTLVVGRTRRTP